MGICNKFGTDPISVISRVFVAAYLFAFPPISLDNDRVARRERAQQIWPLSHMFCSANRAYYPDAFTTLRHGMDAHLTLPDTSRTYALSLLRPAHTLRKLGHSMSSSSFASHALQHCLASGARHAAADTQLLGRALNPACPGQPRVRRHCVSSEMIAC